MRVFYLSLKTIYCLLNESYKINQCQNKYTLVKP